MSTGKLMGAGIASALAASLCCITPVLALIAGTGSMASSFSWIEPARPYMIALTIIVLGLAWYQQLKPKPKDECGCGAAKTRFLQSGKFLLIVTLLAGLMISFPVYSHIFFPEVHKSPTSDSQAYIRTLEVNIQGMTCSACEQHVSYEVNRLPGIVQADVSYPRKNAIIRFDSSRTSGEAIVTSIAKTGYKVINHQFKN